MKTIAPDFNCSVAVSSLTKKIYKISQIFTFNLDGSCSGPNFLFYISLHDSSNKTYRRSFTDICMFTFTIWFILTSEWRH